MPKVKKPKRGKPAASSLIADMLAGDRLSLARVISKIEDRAPELPAIVKALYPKAGKAQVWGITGPPGAGKSTLVDRLTARLRKQGKRVAVVAVDPSSPFTGGAILGDRIRMQEHAGDKGVFIRSLASRGRHGGLSHASKEVVLALDAAGFDVILVETAGVGQTELDILKLAQTVIVVLVPESGDSIQMMKAGLMEIADVFAVNKSDRPEADRMVRDVLGMVELTPHGKESWVMPVTKTEAVRDVGVEELIQHVQAHQSHLEKSGSKDVRLREMLQDEVQQILTEKLSLSVRKTFQSKAGKKLLQDLVDRKTDPYSVAVKISKQS